MAIVDGLSKARMLEIEANSVVDGEIVDRHLILTRHDGSTSDAGDVVGPPVTLVIAAKAVTDLPSTYPTNITTFTFGAETLGWPATLGTVLTYMENDQRGFQIVTEKATQKVWMRVVGANVWGSFFQMAGIDLATQIMTIPRIRLSVTSDASETSTDHAFQIGPTTGVNLIIDDNEILGRNNGALSPVYFNSGLRTPAVPTQPDDVVNVTYANTVRRGQLAQQVFSGGGIRKTTTTGISWGQRFMVMGLGRGVTGWNGYYEIGMPPDGTVIPLYGSNAGSSVTVAGGVIPISSWRALYYDVPFGAIQSTDPSRFKMIDYTAATAQDIPPNWILICTRNADTLSGNYVWGDGRVQDFWKLLTLKNSWTAYNTAFPAPAWRFMGNGKVETHGLMKGGTVGQPTPFATLPYPELAPDGTASFSGWMAITAAAGGAYSARLDIFPGSGDMAVIALGTGASNAYISLDNLSWWPAGA